MGIKLCLGLWVLPPSLACLGQDRVGRVEVGHVVSLSKPRLSWESETALLPSSFLSFRLRSWLSRGRFRLCLTE